MDINTVLLCTFGIALLSVGGALILAGVLAHKALGIVRIDSSVRIDNGATTGDVNTGNGKLHEDWYYDFFMRLNGRLSDAEIELELVKAYFEGRFTGDPEEVVEKARAYIGLAKFAVDKAQKGLFNARWTNEDWWNEWVESVAGNGYFSAN